MRGAVGHGLTKVAAVEQFCVTQALKRFDVTGDGPFASRRRRIRESRWKLIAVLPRCHRFRGVQPLCCTAELGPRGPATGHHEYRENNPEVGICTTKGPVIRFSSHATKAS